MTRAKEMSERAASAGTDAEREVFASAADAQRRVAEGYRTGGESSRAQAEPLGIEPPGLIMKLQIGS